MSDHPTTPELPRAPPPKGWRWKRRRRQKTSAGQFPTGAELLYIARTVGAILFLGLALLAFAMTGWRLSDNAVTYLGYTIVLIVAGIILVGIAGIISPAGSSRRSSKRKKDAREAE